MRRKIYLSVALVLVLCVGCATVNALITHKELTPAARYYDALKTFNSNVETYLQVYDLSDADTKAKWKATVDPAIKIASSALDTWKGQLNTPNAMTAEASWIEARKEAIRLLIESGIIKVQN